MPETAKRRLPDQAPAAVAEPRKTALPLGQSQQKCVTGQDGVGGTLCPAQLNLDFARRGGRAVWWPRRENGKPEFNSAIFPLSRGTAEIIALQVGHFEPFLARPDQCQWDEDDGRNYRNRIRILLNNAQQKMQLRCSAQSPTRSNNASDVGATAPVSMRRDVRSVSILRTFDAQSCRAQLFDHAAPT